MILERINGEFCVCQPKNISDVKFDSEFCFFAKTDEEISLVCLVHDTPSECTAREDGWRCFRISGTLDFSLVGILARIASILADNKISIFAVSTYNTDYVLVKSEYFDKAADVLSKQGYTIKESA